MDWDDKWFIVNAIRDAELSIQHLIAFGILMVLAGCGYTEITRKYAVVGMIIYIIFLFIVIIWRNWSNNE